MMNYSFATVAGIASIKENKTGLTVATGMTANDARARTRHLNFGGGFAGWTPEFFTQKIIPSGE